MSHLDDIDIRRTPETAGPPPRKPRGMWFAIGGLLLAAVVAVYVLLIWNRDPPAEVADTTGVATTTVEAQPEGAPAHDIEVPPLEETDPLVRQLLSALSSHPRLAAWLTTDGLIRNFTVVVDNVASGSSPAPQLTVLKPSETFAVAGQGEQAVIDPASYARYDPLADAFASLDPEGAARIYATLKPRIEEAYRARFIGAPFEERLERAIVLLLQTPEPGADVALKPAGIGYAYADPKLEALSGAQKQLLRMGPRNVRLVKAQLREIALAIGIPAERLPR